MSARQRNITLFVFTLLWTLAIDRFTKRWIIDNFTSTSSSSDFGPISFTFVNNNGAAFGFGQGNGWVFIVCAIVIVAIIVAYVFLGKTRSTLELIALSLVASGGLGNMIDRLSMGSVVDFIKLNFIDFPVFNVADICVTFGVALLIVWMFSSVHKDKREIYEKLQEQSATLRAREKQEHEKAEKQRQIQDGVFVDLDAADDDIDKSWSIDPESGLRYVAPVQGAEMSDVDEDDLDDEDADVEIDQETGLKQVPLLKNDTQTKAR